MHPTFTKSDAVPYILAFASYTSKDIDLLLGRCIAVATLVFTVLKIAQLISNWNKKENKDE